MPFVNFSKIFQNGLKVLTLLKYSLSYKLRLFVICLAVRKLELFSTCLSLSPFFWLYREQSPVIRENPIQIPPLIWMWKHSDLWVLWKWQNINLHWRHKKDLWSLVVLCSEISAQLESLPLSVFLSFTDHRIYMSLRGEA